MLRGTRSTLLADEQSLKADIGDIWGAGERLAEARLPDEATSTQVSVQGAAARHTDRTMGIDVSHYQGIVRWDRVAGKGVVFAYAKVTGGDGW